MKAQRKYWVYWTSVVCCFAFIANARGDVQNQETSEWRKQLGIFTHKKGDVPLIQYLGEMGDKLDCYFTIEVVTNSNSRGFLLWRYVTPSIVPSSLDTLSEQIHKDMPDVTVVRNRETPHVLNLRFEGKDLTKSSPLDLVTDFSINGPLSDVGTESFNQTGGKIIFEISDSIPLGYPADSRTKVKFVSNKTSIRSALTNYVPLSGYNRIIWSASIADIGNKLIARIWQYGTDSNLLFSENDQPIAFVEGRTAFKLNPISAENTQAALQFIEEQMKQKEPRQVRWAMFWLGRHKIEKGVPVLLKYLNYEYAPVPLLDERFPAFRALKEIGAPSAQAALTTMITESSARRLELLTRLVLNVQGEIEGRKSLQSVLAKCKETAQQARLSAAFKAAEEFTPTATVVFPENYLATMSNHAETRVQ